MCWSTTQEVGLRGVVRQGERALPTTGTEVSPPFLPVVSLCDLGSGLGRIRLRIMLAFVDLSGKNEVGARPLFVGAPLLSARWPPLSEQLRRPRFGYPLSGVLPSRARLRFAKVLYHSDQCCIP